MTEAAIRKRLGAYLAGETSLQAFHAWFVPATWDVEETASGATRELVYGIALCLAEYTSGHLTEGDLRVKLGSVSTPTPAREEPATTDAGQASLRALDAEVHRKVMGRKVHPGCHPGTALDGETFYSVPRYSAVMAAAWLVVEKVRERYPVEIHLRKPGGLVACYMDDLVQYAGSAPLAVCVAALKCLGRTAPAPPVNSATPPTPR